MKTRGRKSTTTTSSNPHPDSSTTSTSTPPHPLAPSITTTPPHLFILPTTTTSSSPASRIITLPHPANSQPHRFFLDPPKGFYEFTRLSAPKTACRSLLLTPDISAEAAEGDGGEGYVLRSPDLYVATPVDALWLLLPALCRGDEWGTFHDRLFGMDDGGYEHLRSILRSEEGRVLAEKMEGRMRAVCDVVEMGEESSYKLSHLKLAMYVFKRAERIVKAGLPKSMDEHFVTRVLEKPEMNVRREDSGLSMVEDGQENETTAGAEKTSPSAPTPLSQLARTGSDDEHLTHLLRLRTALTYLTTNYLPASLQTPLHPLLAAQTDFSPLDSHLAHLNQLRCEAQALRSISDNISRKRNGGLDDDEAIERQEAKKRKKEEEDAKKKNMSLGVKKLAKVDTSGMRKMSSFFTKAPSKK